MGIGKAIVENVIKGSTWGMSDFLGVTGKGGLIHDDSPSIIINGDGVYLCKAEIQYGWDDIVSIVPTDEYDSYQVRIRGGLVLSADQAQIGGEDEGEVGDYDGFPECDEYAIANKITKRNIAKFDNGIADLKWAIEKADQIRGSDSRLKLDESELLCYCLSAYNAFDDLNEKLKEEVTNIGEDEWGDIIEQQFLRYIEAGEDDCDVIGRCFLLLGCYSIDKNNCDIRQQHYAYDCLRNARAFGCDVTTFDFLDLSGEENYASFGGVEWKNERRVIVCTDKHAAYETILTGIDIAGTMVMDARDIEEYNEKCDPSLRLIFESGHPRNGCMYVQSPGNPNCYYEVNEYYRGVFEEKYNELKRLLESLGAFEYTVEVESDRSRRVARDSDFGMSGGVEGGRWSANGEYKGQHSDSSARSMFLKYATSGSLNPSGEVRVPDDLFFFEKEAEWQRVAKKAMSGEARKLEITFTCKEAMSFKDSDAKEIAAELKTPIPSFKFKVDKSLKREMEAMNSVSIKYSVSFEDDLGRRAGDFVKERKTATSVKKTLTESEEKFSRYVKKFTVKNNGLVDPMTYQQFLELAESRFQISHDRACDIIDQAMI